MSHNIEITQLEDHRTPLLHQSAANEIEDGRTVDHLITIEETNGRDGTDQLHTHKSTNQIFDALFEDLDKFPIKSCTIFKVNAGLRESNPDAYKPKVVSIGPYHRKNPQLHPMEKYKLLYLRRFLKRKEGLSVESCIRELDKLKDEALKCYDDIENVDSDIIEKFSEMLLLDGCFVVEWIREGLVRGEELIINSWNTDNQIRGDLLLLENQLPFFILAAIHDMTMRQGEESFIKQVKRFISFSLRMMNPASLFQYEGDDAKNIKHLLEALHMSCRPNHKTEVKQHSKRSLCSNPFKIIMSKLMGKDTEDLTIRQGHLPNATELHEAGVRFSKAGNNYRYIDLVDNNEDSTSLFDISFENGRMKLPCIKIYDDTEPLLRNLVAYEQLGLVSPAYFSDFVFFVDHLIDTDKDVTLLRLIGIIWNDIGDDQAVATFFNNMGKGVVHSPDDFYYKEVRRKAVLHCEEPWNRMKANLRRNYFNSTWAGISTVAAIILLLLTLTQTVLTFFSVFKYY